MFDDMLRTQLLLKNVVTPEDWEVMSDHIQYDFLYDNHFAELKEAELMQERVNIAQLVDPYVGRYYSADYVRRKILRQTDEEIIEQDKLIEEEIAKGIIPDPNAVMMEPGAPQPGGANAMAAPESPKDPEPPETPAGGEI